MAERKQSSAMASADRIVYMRCLKQIRNGEIVVNQDWDRMFFNKDAFKSLTEELSKRCRELTNKNGTRING